MNRDLALRLALADPGTRLMYSMPSLASLASVGGSLGRLAKPHVTAAEFNRREGGDGHYRDFNTSNPVARLRYALETWVAEAMVWAASAFPPYGAASAEDLAWRRPRAGVPWAEARPDGLALYSPDAYARWRAVAAANAGAVVETIPAPEHLALRAAAPLYSRTTVATGGNERWAVQLVDPAPAKIALRFRDADRTVALFLSGPKPSRRNAARAQFSDVVLETGANGAERVLLLRNSMGLTDGVQLVRADRLRIFGTDVDFADLSFAWRSAPSALYREPIDLVVLHFREKTGRTRVDETRVLVLQSPRVALRGNVLVARDDQPLSWALVNQAGRSLTWDLSSLMPRRVPMAMTSDPSVENAAADDEA